MVKIVINRGWLITLLLGAISCYLIYILWVGHSHRNDIKSIINNVIDKSNEQKVINYNEESVDNKKELLIKETTRSIWY